MNLQVLEYYIMKNPQSFNSTCSISVLFVGLMGTTKKGKNLIINKWTLIVWSSGIYLDDYFGNAKFNFFI